VAVTLDKVGSVASFYAILIVPYEALSHSALAGSYGLVKTERVYIGTDYDGEKLRTIHQHLLLTNYFPLTYCTRQDSYPHMTAFGASWV
jgi:hypothetical protein